MIAGDWDLAQLHPHPPYSHIAKPVEDLQHSKRNLGSYVTKNVNFIIIYLPIRITDIQEKWKTYTSV